MVCPGTKANHFNEDDEVPASQELESLHQETFGDAVESEAGDELPEGADGRPASDPRKGLGDVGGQCTAFSAEEASQAMHGI